MTNDYKMVIDCQNLIFFLNYIYMFHSGIRRWITLKPLFGSMPRNQKTEVMDFLVQHCRSKGDESFRKRILYRYSLLVEYVEVDPLGILVQPTRIDRVSFN